MGSIIVKVIVKNFKDLTANPLVFNAMVDTGASHLVLPLAWKASLGECYRTRFIDIALADDSLIKGEICGPVEILVEGFTPINGEVLFIDMRKSPTEGSYQPLLGHIPLEAIPVGVDMLNLRLVPLKTLNCK